MLEENKNEKFSYTYSAEQQDEIEKIRRKYIPHEENKMELLRKLDQSVEKPGKIASITIGVFSLLLFGTGMACIMEWENLFIVGIIVGVIGIAGMSLAYPVFNVMTKKQREKIAPQIIKLTDELKQ